MDAPRRRRPRRALRARRRGPRGGAGRWRRRPAVEVGRDAPAGAVRRADGADPRRSPRPPRRARRRAPPAPTAASCAPASPPPRPRRRRTRAPRCGAARRAARAGDGRALAAARGALRGALFRGAAAVTLDAVRAGDTATARSWLLLREFRTATRLTRPGADATLAVGGLERGRIEAGPAAEAVQKDLLDAYQARQRELLADADTALERGLRDAAGRGRRPGRRPTGRSSSRATSRTAARPPPTRSARRSPRWRAPRARGDAAGFRAARAAGRPTGWRTSPPRR